MLMKRAFILIIFILQYTSFYSQNNDGKSISIYFEGNGYLQLYIESILKDLNDENKQYLFENVTVLNRYIDENEYQAKFQQLINTYLNKDDNSRNTYSEEELIIRKKSKGNLTGNQYFLNVKTITLVELIEFQFQLFETTGSTNSEEINIPFNNINELVGSEDIFINPKERFHKEDIQKAIQRLFKDSNTPPIAELFFLDEKLYSGDTLYIPINTKIKIDGSQSGDFENEKITYKWRNISPDKSKIQTSNKIKLIDSLSVQNFYITKKGDYKIGFSVFDGIERSSEINLNIIAINKPVKIIVPDSIKVSRQTMGILNRDIGNSQKSTFKILNDTTEVKNILISDKIQGIKIDKEKDYNLIANKLNTSIVVEDNFQGYTNKEYFLYSLDSLGFLSDPTIIYHEPEYLGLISFGFLTTYNALFYNVSNGDPLDLVENDELYESGVFSTMGEVVAQKLFFNISFTNRIGLSMGTHIGKKTIDLKKISLDFPAIAFFNLEYRFSDANIYKNRIEFSSKLLFIYNIYSGTENYISNVSNSVEVNESQISGFDSVGYGLEIEMNAIDINSIKSNLIFRISNSHFLGNETSALRDFQIGLGLKFYFKSYYNKN